MWLLLKDCPRVPKYFSAENISMQLKTSLRYLEDRWDPQIARSLDQPELLRYRSNLLGSDLRITNFGGGNTSSKIQQVDPLSGKQEEILWIKGSGGDLGSIKLAGLAALYSEKLHGLEKHISWRGVRRRDGGHVSAMRVRQELRLPPRLTRRCMASCLSATSTIYIPTGALPWPLPPMGVKRWKSSIAFLTTILSGCRGSVLGLNWP